MKFSYEHSGILQSKINTSVATLNTLTETIRDVVAKKKYDSCYASLILPFDQDLRTDVKRVVNQKKKLNVDYIVVIGIGGSNLGTMAVSRALFGNTAHILYADAADPDSLADIIERITPALKKKVLLNVISKSGGTSETLANFQVLLELLAKKNRKYHEYVVVTTDEGSALWNVAKQEGFDVLAIPKNVGGRYSVLSAVGLFPLSMLGVNTSQLQLGARDMFSSCVTGENIAAISAVLQYHQYKQGRNISDMFLFDSHLEPLGKWYRQLMGESLGKQYNRKGKQVNVGITPTVSIGSTDLHSVGQLYLGGPQDKYTTFVTVNKPHHKFTVPAMSEYAFLPMIQNKSFAQINDAIVQGTQIAFRKGKRPFCQIVLEKTPYSLGAFLQFKMLEMMYLGELLDVNAFDQPSVESYKIETKRLLS